MSRYLGINNVIPGFYVAEKKPGNKDYMIFSSDSKELITRGGRRSSKNVTIKIQPTQTKNKDGKKGFDDGCKGIWTAYSHRIDGKSTETGPYFFATSAYDSDDIPMKIDLPDKDSPDKDTAKDALFVPTKRKLSSECAPSAKKVLHPGPPVDTDDE